MDGDVAVDEPRRSWLRRFLSAFRRFFGGFVMEAIDGSNLVENRWVRRGQITYLVVFLVVWLFLCYLVATGHEL
ncbi:MAG: hypothetical protein JHD16_16720 [Solirubrobacteraceae bacterium]|nr:hypothetical protein [Solirubrobacteraceae bacterium]